MFFFFFSGTFCVNSDGSTAPVFHHEFAEKPGTLPVFGLKISAECVLIATLMTYDIHVGHLYAR